MKEKLAGEMTETEGSSETKEKKPKSKKKYILIALILILVATLAVAAYLYYREIVYYQTHFFPNTNINGMDCSNMEVTAVIDALEARIDGYALAVVGRDYRTGEPDAILGVIEPDDIGLKYVGTGEAVEVLLQQQDEFMWIEAYWDRQYIYSLEQDINFDKKLLESTVKSWDACKRKNMKIAQDAHLSEYLEEKGGYEVIPETMGTELDINKALSLIVEAVAGQAASVDLDEQECYKEASIKSDDRKLNRIVNNANKWLGTKIIYDWNGTEVVLDNEILKDWITIEEDGNVVLNEEAAGTFVKEQAKAYDTYGKKKKFMTTHGYEITLPGRNYGWKTDVEGETKELIKLVRQGSSIEKEPLYSIRAGQKGSNDIGDSYVEADLSGQHLYLYQDGNLVLETDFVSGTMVSSRDCVTPEGVFGLLYKTTDAVLRGETYRTPVKYWMPFYGNYGMHDANWRGAFGGSIFITNGSHGCINLPPSAAEKIYQYVSEGFPVVCYYPDGIPYIGPPPEPPTEGAEGQVPGEGQENPGGQVPIEGQTNPEGQVPAETQTDPNVTPAA